MTYWAIITRPSDRLGPWRVGYTELYEDRRDAIAAAQQHWAGSGVDWRLITIQGEED